MERVIAIFADNFEYTVTEVYNSVIKEELEPYSTIPPEQLRNMIARVVNLFFEDLSNKTPGAFAAYWEEVAGARAVQGVSINSMHQVITMGATIMDEAMVRLLADDHTGLLWWFSHARKIILDGSSALSQAFIAAHEKIIRNQASQLRALASPIVPVYTGILVLPLVGEVDTRRASQIMESLLEEIVHTQADVVLIDVTGVPLVDAEVANSMIQLARAAQLLGTQVLLVGISAEIAQTIVQLGVELGSLVTRSNLQSGIEYALHLQGRAIQPLLQREQP